jgi:hypothetical protein
MYTDNNIGGITLTGCPATPPSPYGPAGSGIPPKGSVTYDVRVVGNPNPNPVDTVTYTWDYAI